MLKIIGLMIESSYSKQLSDNITLSQGQGLSSSHLSFVSPATQPFFSYDSYGYVEAHWGVKYG